MQDHVARRIPASESGAPERAGAATTPPGTLPAGSRVGEFEILGLLGEGGMGVVYRARQENPEREVALKLIRGRVMGRDALKRFEFEAQVLARLQHPGVAQIYQAGFIGEDPYFAMELVVGEPLSDYARRHGLGQRAQLELVVKICAAVQSAHAKGVVHRDLKPANILVTAEGQPKILDFGVARATDSDIATATVLTEIGQLVGTVPYMSPEQAAGDSTAIDTRSDVYSLGVLTYELLTGFLPYDLSAKMVHEAVRIIREQDARPLSSVHRSFSGDVDVIVAKALEKDKERRYQSAKDFGDDIERFLGDQPIVARPPSAAYQLQKFARRNRVLVGGVAAVFVALVLGLVGTLWQANRAAERARTAEDAERSARLSEERAVAEARRAQEAEAQALAEARRASEAESAARREERTATFVSDFLGEMFKGIGPQVALGRDTELLREIVDRAQERLERELVDEPRVRSRLLRVLGIVYHDLGEYEPAEKLVKLAVAAAREVEGESGPAVARSLYELARVFESRKRYEEAAEIYQSAYDMHVAAGTQDSHEALATLGGVGVVHYYQRRHDKAAEILGEVLDRRRRAHGNEPSDALSNAIERYAFSISERDPDEALEILREALAMRRRVHGDEHPQVALSLVNLATQLGQRGKLEEALPLAEEGLNLHRAIYGDQHPYLATALVSTAPLYERAGRIDDTIAMQREALAIHLARLGPDARQTLDSNWLLGSLLERTGDDAGAEEQYGAMLRWARANHPPGDNRTSSVLLLVADAIARQDRQAEAEPLYREAHEALLVGRAPGHAQIAKSRRALALCLVAQRKFAQAEPLLLAAHADAAARTDDSAGEAATLLADLYERWAGDDAASPTPSDEGSARALQSAAWRQRASESGPR